MKFPNSIKPLILAVALAVAGSASATTYNFSTFTLDVDFTDFSGTSLVQSGDGFSFGGYAITSTEVLNQIAFTLQLKDGYKLDSLSFVDFGTFSGGLNKFKVADEFSSIGAQATKELNPGKASGTWSFYASTADVQQGTIAYSLKSAPGYSATSEGGSFNVKTVPVPEPESYAMFLAGLGIMGAMARRRRHQI